MNLSNNKKLRRFRKLLEISLDVVSNEVGISTGFLNRYERGFIKEIKNIQKKERLEFYIKKLEEKANIEFKEVI